MKAFSTLNQYNQAVKQPLKSSAFSLRPVIEHVYAEHLSHHYARKYVKLCPKASSLARHGKVVPRPNHGLAHTLRSIKLAPLVAKYYQRYANNADLFHFTKEDIYKIQVALAFFVVGRENEMGFQDNPAIYNEFRLNSAQAFKHYCQEHLMHLFKTQYEIDRYAGILLNYADPVNQSKEAVIIRQSHCLDLLRCRNWEELKGGVMQEIQSDFNRSGKVKELIDYTAKLLLATGNRIPDGPYKERCHFNRFAECSTNIDYCLDQLNAVPLPSLSRKVKRY